MTLTLTSGRQIECYAPDLAALAAQNGSVAAIAATATSERLSFDDALLVAEWALARFSETDEGLALAAACDRFACRPSVILPVSLRILAARFDIAMALALCRAEQPQGDAPPVTVAVVPDEWEPDPS
jgi:hypothetical protein